MTGPVEPNAEYRALAVKAYELFVALTQAGFTEDQALRMVTDVIK